MSISTRAAAVLARVEWPTKPGVVERRRPADACRVHAIRSRPEVYRNACQSCHQPDGRGQDRVAASLVGSTFALAVPEVPIRILLGGKEGDIGLMPPLGSMLSDDQIAAVLTYVRREWGQSAARPSSRTSSQASARPRPADHGRGRTTNCRKWRRERADRNNPRRWPVVAAAVNLRCRRLSASSADSDVPSVAGPSFRIRPMDRTSSRSATSPAATSTTSSRSGSIRWARRARGRSSRAVSRTCRAATDRSSRSMRPTATRLWIHEGPQGLTPRGMNYWQSADGKDRRISFRGRKLSAGDRRQHRPVDPVVRPKRRRGPARRSRPRARNATRPVEQPGQGV